jgi:VAD1 Analog of StAR-related lipid transfer domain
MRPHATQVETIRFPVGQILSRHFDGSTGAPHFFLYGNEFLQSLTTSPSESVTASRIERALFQRMTDQSDAPIDEFIPSAKEVGDDDPIDSCFVEDFETNLMDCSETTETHQTSLVSTLDAIESNHSPSWNVSLTTDAAHPTQRHLTSQDGPSNHQVHVVSVPVPKTVSDHRRSLSTGNVPNRLVNDGEEKNLLKDAAPTPETLNDDASSVASTVASSTYFDLSDFDPSTWHAVVWNHASTMGMFVVALATAITHPLFFLVGAMAALATTTQREDVGRSTFCFDTSLFWPMSDTEAAIDESESVAEVQGLPSSILEEKKQEETDVAIPAVAPPPLPPPEEPCTVPRHSLRKEDQAAWLQRHFPPLQHAVLERSDRNSDPALKGLNTVDCFRVFFDNDAPYSFLTFQQKRGDQHIKYGHWGDLPLSGPISMFDHPEAMKFPKDLKIRFFKGRFMTFQAKTNSFLGPPFASTRKSQIFLLVHRRLAILESKTVLSGIPFADRFFVGERWIFTAEKVEQLYVTTVQVSCQVFFNGPCPFEQPIQSKSVSTIKDVVTSWYTMAREALKLTEMAKNDRLHRTEEDDWTDDETLETPTDKPNEISTVVDGVEVLAEEYLLQPSPSNTPMRSQRSRTSSFFRRRRHSFDEKCVMLP